MSVYYAIRPAQPGAHLFHVVCRVERPDPRGQRFMLPAWVPGSYMIREFARHVIRVTALAGDRKLDVRKLDKHTWQVEPAARPIELVYEVYAWDLSVRAAHLDDTHGFFNGASVFMLPSGFEREPCDVDLLPPEGAQFQAWRVVTALAPARGTRRLNFGRYRAADYAELIDCPVEMGTFALGRFDVSGVTHEIAVTGHVPRLDMDRLTADLARLCAGHVRLFEPKTRKPPFKRYLFLTLAVDDGYGGLEHRASTALICKRADLPFVGMKAATEGYRTFLGLASHEYFHAWNVKRIRPAPFVGYDLTRENYTRLLWAFEGFTSYYDDLLLARSRLISEQQYLDGLAKTMTTVLQRSSRFKQSVADSSFDAWIKYYRQDENAPNAVVSYYQKGALIALALDLTIRAESGGKRSLDDVLRLLWTRYLAAGASYAGVADDEIATAAEVATGLALRQRLVAWTEGTADPDFATLFAPFGIAFQTKPAVDEPGFALLGVKTTASGSDCRVSQVYDGSPAQAAGLSAHDTLIAIDGLRVTAKNFDNLLTRYAAGDRIEVLAFRRDELMRFELRLATQPPARVVLEPDAKPARSAADLRARWLSG
jgi:predicted metalloprotease with PDZ domain